MLSTTNKCVNFINFLVQFFTGKMSRYPPIFYIPCSKSIFTSFQHLTPNFTIFYQFLPTFTLFLPTFTNFYYLPPAFITFHHFLPAFTTSYYRPPAFTIFHYFLPTFILYLLISILFLANFTTFYYLP